MISNITSPFNKQSNSGPIERSVKDKISVSILKSHRESTDGQDEKASPAEADAASELPVSDPLKWFGVLVPPALRVSQNSFRNAVTETVPSLANISNEMRALEVDIRRVRKKIRRAG